MSKFENKITKSKMKLKSFSSVPATYLDDFRNDIVDTNIDLDEEKYEPTPHMALEWVIPTAIIVYITKPFIDALIKRAADEFGDAVYPRLRSAIVNLTKKIFISDRLPIKRITVRGEEKSESIFFSIESETITKNHIKFVFNERLPEDKYRKCIDQVFKVLLENHNSKNKDDILSEQIRQLPEDRRDRIFMVYDSALDLWCVRDPIQESIDSSHRDKK